MKKGISGLGILSGLKVFQEETSPSTNVGALAHGAMGEKFRYVRVGASALVLGNLLQGPINNTTDFDVLTTAAFSAGDTTMTITTGATAMTLNEFAGGTVTIGIAGGVLIGSYTIASHPAASTTSTCVLTLAEPLRIAGTSSQKSTLRRNQWSGVLQSAATPTSSPVGVALTAATASTATVNVYTWIQSAGICAVLSDNSTIVVGSDVGQSSTAGAVILANGVLGRVGRALSAKNSTGLIPVKLEID